MSDGPWTLRKIKRALGRAPLKRGRGTAAFTSSVDVKKLHKRGFTTKAFHNSCARSLRFETRAGHTCGRVDHYIRQTVSPLDRYAWSSVVNRTRLLFTRQYPRSHCLATDTTDGSPQNTCLPTAVNESTSAVWEPDSSNSAQRRSLLLHSLQEDKRFSSYGVELCDFNDEFLLRLLHTRQRHSQQAAHARLCPQERVEMEKHRHILRSQFHYRRMGSAVVCPAENNFCTGQWFLSQTSASARKCVMWFTSECE